MAILHWFAAYCLPHTPTILGDQRTAWQASFHTCRVTQLRGKQGVALLAVDHFGKSLNNIMDANLIPLGTTEEQRLQLGEKERGVLLAPALHIEVSFGPREAVRINLEGVEEVEEFGGEVHLFGWKRLPPRSTRERSQTTLDLKVEAGLFR